MVANLSVPSITEQIKTIRQEIFRLAKLSPNLEVMHWYMWLDSCFENDEFNPQEFGNVQWRCFVLQSKKQPVEGLLGMISRVLFMTGCIDWQGKPVQGLEEKAEGRQEPANIAGTIFLGSQEE